MTKIKQFNLKSWWILILIFSFTLVRIYRLDDTARFTQDESTDLARMASYWKDKKITLVGPISTDNGKVFGSLTYYMQMPFAVIGQFDPISPVYAMAFWGVLTALLILVITRYVNPKYSFLAIVLGLIWHPLLETSRWAWNPHLVLFWVAMGLFIYFVAKKPIHLFLMGMCFGLTIHHHYIAFIATAVFIVWQFIKLVRTKKSQEAILLVMGYGLTLLPFAIFDLRHPPGLFINHYLLGGNTPHMAIGVSGLWQRLGTSFYMSSMTVVKNSSFAIGILIVSGLMIITDFRTRLRHILWLLPVFSQILAGLFLSNYETRYFLPALLFYYVWLIQARLGFGKFLQQLLIIMIVVGSVWTIPLLTKPEAQPTIRVLREATTQITSIYQENTIKNGNVTSVASPDGDLIGLKYRDLLSLKNITLRAPSEYDASENLFVVSTSSEETIRRDESNPMTIFKNTSLKGTYSLSDPWKLYWFAYE